MGLDIQSEGFNNCAVMKTDAKIWKTIKMYRTIRKAGFYGT